MKESQPWTDLPYEREPAMDRSTLGERASHGQIYLMRERASHGQIYLMRESHGQIYLMRESSHGQIYLMREPAMDRSTL